MVGCTVPIWPTSERRPQSNRQPEKEVLRQMNFHARPGPKYLWRCFLLKLAIMEKTTGLVTAALTFWLLNWGCKYSIG